MDAKKLFVHDRRQRQSTERLDASLVNPLAVLVLALQLKGKIVRQMSTLVVAPQQPERIRVPDL